jgi:ELWxxDGT repeat protein
MSTSNGDEEQRCGGRTKARLGLAIYVLATVLSPGLSSPAAAQPLDTPYLVRDIANTAPVAQADTHLMFETAVNGRALFWAASDSAGSYWTLWSTDGTAVGTVPISDLLAYEATSSLNSATLCADAQRWMLWAPGSPGGTRSVWASDGTNVGTAMVTPLPPNSIPGLTYPGPEACEARELGGRVLFWIAKLQALENPTYELWSTDGTFAGTQRVAQLGQDSGFWSGVPDFIRLGDKILFSLQTVPNGFELWRTDGTEAGTEPFLSQLAGMDTLAAQGFVRVGAWAFFVESFAGGLAPLAVTDGTAGGTRVFEDLLPLGSSAEEGYEPVALADRLVLAATAAGPPQLWAVIPTELDPDVLTSLVGAISIRRLAPQAIGGRALFVATLPEPPSDTRDHLLLSDGTAMGTIDVAVGCDAVGFCGIQDLGTMGGTAYFLVSDTSGTSLWKTDGTAPGTAQIEALDCASGCEMRAFGVSEARLYFLKRSLGESPALWVSDGAAAGTFEVLPPGPIDNYWTTGAGSAALPGGRLVFGAHGAETGFEPWITDGTPSGTHVLVNLSAASDPSLPKRFSAYGDRVLFSAQESVHGEEPWVSGGSGVSTGMVVDVRPGVGGSWLVPFQPADGIWPIQADPEGTGSSQRLYSTTGAPGSLGALGPESFWGSSSLSFNGRSLITSGVKLFAFDGSPPSVNLLAEIGAGFDIFPFLAAGAQRVYFRNLLAGEPHELWTTDATEAGTHSFCAAPDFQSFSPGSWIGELGSGVVFKARTEALGVETYFCHEGEAAILLADIAAGAADADPEGFIAVGGWSLFAATNAAGDRELWRTDGTVAGTGLLANLSPSGSSAPAEFSPVVGGVLFTADDGLHGRELWFSDGTAAGTAMVADLAPGPMSSQPADFEPIGGAFVFAAETLAAGRELWVTGATAESTGPLPEIRPGPLSSWPEELTATQHRVFLRATDERGSEPWALCPSWVAGTAQACNELFADGFEAGSAARWSASTP